MKRLSSSTSCRALAAPILVALLGWLTASSPAAAQPDAASPPTGEPSGPLALPLFGSSGLDVRWRVLRVAEPGSEEEARAFEAVVAAREELGIPELPDHASVLLQDARPAWNAGDLERAETLFAWAHTLAPSSGEPDFVRADLLWHGRPWDAPALVSATLAAYGRALASPLDGPATELHWGLVLAWLVLGVCLAFVLVQLGRYAKLAAYDVASVAGHVVSRTWASLVLVALLALPAILLQSPILLLLLALPLPLAYQTRSEAIATVLLLALLGAAPLLLAQLGAVVARGATPVARVFAAERGPCDSECRATLDRLSRAHPDAAYPATTAAAVRLRTGQPRELAEALTILAPHTDDPRLGGLASLLAGNAHYQLGDLAGARADWGAAVQRAGTAPDIARAAHFNLSRAAADEGRTADAEAELESARALGAGPVDALVASGERRTNRWLLSATAPPEVVRELMAAVEHATARRAALELWAPVGGRLAPATASILALLGLAFVGAGNALRRRFRVAAACPTCGAVMSLRDAPDAAAAGYCPDCYALFMAGAALPPAERAHLESRVDRHLERSRRFWLAGNVLGAGFGFLGRGAAWPGLPLVGLALTGGVLWLVASPAVARSLAFAPDAFDGRAALAVLCWAIAYPTSWILTWRRRERRVR